MPLDFGRGPSLWRCAGEALCDVVRVMGMDLDLAVSHSDSGFDESYRLDFEAMRDVARAALGERGLALPEERPLPPRFPFRVHLGSYSTASALLQSIDRFVDHLRRHRTLPGLVAPAPVEGGALPAVLRSLAGADHLVFALGALFVPVDFEAPIHASLGAETMWIASAPRALAVLRIVDELSHLDEASVWDYRELFSEAPGEAFAGYRFFSEGFPVYDELWGVGRIHEALRLSVEHRVCLTVS
jgi:hypothetical protein